MRVKWLLVPVGLLALAFIPGDEAFGQRGGRGGGGGGGGRGAVAGARRRWRCPRWRSCRRSIRRRRRWCTQHGNGDRSCRRLSIGG